MSCHSELKLPKEKGGIPNLRLHNKPSRDRIINTSARADGIAQPGLPVVGTFSPTFKKLWRHRDCLQFPALFIFGDFLEYVMF